MKKLLFVAALGVASLVSAKNFKSEFFISKTNMMIGGYCNVDIYEQNADGSTTYIGSWGGYADSQESCNAKGRWILAQLQMGLEPVW